MNGYSLVSAMRLLLINYYRPIYRPYTASSYYHYCHKLPVTASGTCFNRQVRCATVYFICHLLCIIFRYASLLCLK